MPDVKVVTFNARGLRLASKRRTLFRFLHQYYPAHIVVLQETHSRARDVTFWQAEWGSDIVFSHGPRVSECGVAVLLPRSLKGSAEYKVAYCDDNGRMIVLHFTYQECNLTIFALYAPTSNHSRSQVEFFDTLGSQLKSIDPEERKHILICGDLNVHLTRLDIDSRRFRLTLAAKRMISLLDEFDLVDIWRYKNPLLRRYTWRRLAPLQQSRIDYMIISRTIVENQVVNNIDLKPGVLSDHSLVNLEVRLFACKGGPGLWRFNNSLIEDRVFVETVRMEVEAVRQNAAPYENVDDIGLKLEMICSQIRVHSIKRGKCIAQQRREETDEIIRGLNVCEVDMCTDPSDEVLNRYKELRQRLDAIEELKGRRAMIRSGAKWLEDGEKPTKYFFNLNARRDARKQISVLEIPDDRVLTDCRDILNYCADYFNDIFRSKINVNEDGNLTRIANFFEGLTIPRLDDTEKQSCDGPLSNAECRKALHGMMNNKSPSVSGFSKEFFAFFWDELGDLIVSYINRAREVGRFFVTQRRGVITLIPKKGDQKLLKNKRAICLLDVVYKIAAKAIANRLMAIIHKLVATDQTGSIRGRFIGTNLRTIADVIEYCHMDNVDGLVMALDFKNAFNTVEHCFVWQILREFNFGENFVSWVQLLHRSNELAVINNGYTSRWIEPSRGLQQGCPASAPIFALVVEILAIRLRESNSIRGISISGEEFKISQYCDDTTVFVSDNQSADNVIQTVTEFGKISGLELNLEKCEFMWLGRLRHCRQPICGKTPSEKLKILGVWFSASQECNDMNVEPVISKVKNVLDQWSQRGLTIKGKITVAKSLIVSQLVYLMSAVSIERTPLDLIQGNIMKFVWRGRPPKVAKKTL